MYVMRALLTSAQLSLASIYIFSRTGCTANKIMSFSQNSKSHGFTSKSLEMGMKKMLYTPGTSCSVLGKWLKSGHVRTFAIILVPFVLCYILFFVPAKHSYETAGPHLHETVLSQQDIYAPDSKTLYKRHMEAVQIGCGDICKVDNAGSPSLFHNFIEKKVDCRSLLSNPAIDATMTEANPPETIPEEMLDAFTYNGQVPVRPWSSKILNQRYLGKEVS